jgi:hypothetical protein
VARFGHFDPSERELLDALAHTIEEETGRPDVTGCPREPELRRLAKGACNNPSRRTEMLAHLADCNHCIQTMKRIRQRRVLRQRAAVLASVLIVSMSAWICGQHRPGANRNGVATIDLRVVSLTRGDENNVTRESARVRRQASQLRVILPLGSDGTYEAEILPDASRVPTLAHASGSTKVEDHTVVLSLPFDLSAVRSGNYSLALRRSGGDWEYYALTVE